MTCHSNKCQLVEEGIFPVQQRPTPRPKQWCQMVAGEPGRGQAPSEEMKPDVKRLFVDN